MASYALIYQLSGIGNAVGTCGCGLGLGVVALALLTSLTDSLKRFHDCSSVESTKSWL